MKVLLIRANRNEPDAIELEKFGIQSFTDPFLEISQVQNPLGAKKMQEALSSPGEKWLVVSSTNALNFWSQLLPSGELESSLRSAPELKFAAIGEQTESQLLELGADKVLRPDLESGASLAMKLSEQKPAPIILPTGSISMKEIPNTLTPLGFPLISEVVYATELVSKVPESVAKIAAGEIDAVIVRSPSAARALCHFVPNCKVPVICAGQTTAKEASRLKLNIGVVSNRPTPSEVALTTNEYFGIKK
jgi:uroporphyrinogen-III synthase